MSAPGYTIADTAITVGSTSNWSTDTGVVFAIDEAQVVDGQEIQVAGTYNEYIGVVSSGTSVTSVAWQTGVGDRNYTSGALTRVYIPVSAERENRIVTWGTAQHNQDGTHKAITTDTLVASSTVTGAGVISTGDVQLRSTSIETIRSETEFDYVASGCVLSGTGYGSTLNWSLTAGVVYIGGKRFTVASATGTVTASKDTYFDLLNPGSGTVATLVNTGGNIVANNAASPALAALSLRLGIIVSGASNIANVAAVNQGEIGKALPIASSVKYEVTDSLGNLICPRDPVRTTLGYKTISVLSTTSVTDVQLVGSVVTINVPASLAGRKAKVSTGNLTITNTTATAYTSPSLYSGTTVGGGTLLTRTYAIPSVASGFQSTSLSTDVMLTAGAMNFFVAALVQSGTGGINNYGGEHIKVELV